MACCVLHNLCEKHNEYFDEEVVVGRVGEAGQGGGEDDVEQRNQAHNGHDIRIALCLFR